MLKISAVLALGVMGCVSAGLPAAAESYCASSDQTASIANFFVDRPGAPLAIPARHLDLPEQVVASGVPDGVTSFGVAATPELVKQVWATIDAWGAETEIHTVFTMGGKHVADMNTLVPITQPDDGSGFIDIYADNGDGVHGHLMLERIGAIYVNEMPRDDGVTRGVSFYNQAGVLVVGVYASIVGKPFDQAAVDGFEATKTLVAGLPQLCD